MDENNLPQENWLDELMSTPELEDEMPALVLEPVPEPEPPAPVPRNLAEGDTQPLPEFPKASSEADEELERILREIKSMEQEQAAEAGIGAEEEMFKDDDFREAFGEGEDLMQMFSDEPMPTIPNQKASQETAEEPAEQTEEEGPVEKGRPKRKKGYGLFGLPHLAATVVWIVIIITIGVSIGRLGWLCASDVLALGREPITATVTIEEGDSLDTIAQKLKDAGLIEYPGIFKFYANFTDAQEKIKPGTYVFSAVNEDNETIVYDYMALVSVMSPSGNRLEVVEDLRIPEGYTCAQIFQLLEEKNVCTVAEMEAYVASLSLPESEDEEADPLTQYWFLEGVTWGDKYSLEGYLFPDTYDFYVNDDPERVIRKMLDAFDASFTDIMRANLEKVEGYTIREIIIIASMIEKEAASTSESYTVSSVIFNRLNDPANYPYLNIDATIVYALGGKSDLTEEDLKIDSPYNTYTNKGLPPGPIANPSQNSIAAALTPEDTVDENGKSVKYYYYALDPSTQLHHFSQTYKEHQAFLESLKEDE